MNLGANENVLKSKFTQTTPQSYSIIMVKMQGAKTNEAWIINIKHQSSEVNYDGKDAQKIVSI